ncbi:MAG TPA: hypothetical protein VLM85_16015 [Polyangiaceae bacterium]|nr:hypothetical protein [Polyangiaceae bacterium]
MLPFDNDPTLGRAELERGLREVPAYVAWRSFDPGPTAAVDARYAALPATTKELMLNHAPRGFVPATADVDGALAHGETELVRTSGTTGPPVTLVWSQAWWDASERASWQLNADVAAVATGWHREAVLASPRCVGPEESDRPRTARERTLGRLLFLNEHADVARWSDETVRRMLGELRDYAPAILEAEPVYAAALCARAEALGSKLPRPRAVVLTYAMPSRLDRRRIRRALGAAVVSSYGSTETGYVLVECERGRMHHVAASCRLDFVPLRRTPNVGRLLVTPFGHPWACILKFDVGDLARRALGPCPCGRPGGAIERIEGRVEEATIASHGRVVTAAELDDAIAATPSSEHIVSYQLEQSVDGLHLRMTVAGEVDRDRVAASLRALYGREARIAMELVDALDPEPSGKYVRVRQRLELDRRAWFAE